MIAFAPAELAPGESVIADMVHLAPMMIVAIWAVIGLVAEAFSGPGLRTFQKGLGLLGVGFAVAASVSQFGNFEYDASVRVFGGFLVVDQFSILLDLAILGVVAAVMMFAGDYARSHHFEFGEQEELLFIAAFGMMILAHAGDLLAIFLGIETMSLAVYVLVGSRWNSRKSPEAALKYFIMGAFASGVLVMGIALIYGATGTTVLSELPGAVTQIFTKWGAADQYAQAALRPVGEVPVDALKEATDKAVTGMAPAALFIPGLFLTLSGLLFKVSAVPFHMWTPDAYDGAPTPTTAFMAAGVKIGAFAAVLKLMVGVFFAQRLVTAPYGWTSAVAVIAFFTMTVGNLAAVRQTNVKRLLAYSSIAHVGYILVGVVAAANFYGHAYFAGSLKPADQVVWARTTGDLAVASILYYVITYAVATLGAFAAVSWFGANKKEGIAAHEWSGMAQRHPRIALGLTVCLLSLMGMPPLAGFFGKLFVFRAAFENDNWVLRSLVVAALLNAVVGAYYYLRLIVAMYFRPPPKHDQETLPGAGAQTVVALAAIASLVFGVAADPVMKRCELASAGFVFPPGDKRAQWVDRLRERWGQPVAEAEREARRPTGSAADAKSPPAANADAKQPTQADAPDLKLKQRARPPPTKRAPPPAPRKVPTPAKPGSPSPTKAGKAQPRPTNARKAPR